MKLLSPVLLALLTAQAVAQQVIVVRDPDTGQTRAATAAEMAELKAKASPSLLKAPRPPKVQERSDGSQRLGLDRSHLSYTLVRRAPDGSLQQSCVHGDNAAQKALSSPVEVRHEDR